MLNNRGRSSEQRVRTSCNRTVKSPSSLLAQVLALWPPPSREAPSSLTCRLEQPPVHLHRHRAVADLASRENTGRLVLAVTKAQCDLMCLVHLGQNFFVGISDETKLFGWVGCLKEISRHRKLGMACHSRDTSVHALHVDVAQNGFPYAGTITLPSMDAERSGAGPVFQWGSDLESWHPTDDVGRKQIWMTNNPSLHMQPWRQGRQRFYVLKRVGN